jgi:hypothetical protein
MSNCAILVAIGLPRSARVDTAVGSIGASASRADCHEDAEHPSRPSGDDPFCNLICKVKPLMSPPDVRLCGKNGHARRARLGRNLARLGPPAMSAIAPLLCDKRTSNSANLTASIYEYTT